MTIKEKLSKGYTDEELIEIIATIMAVTAVKVLEVKVDTFEELEGITVSMKSYAKQILETPILEEKEREQK